MSVLLSTTPLEMDDDLMMSSVNIQKESSIRLENSCEFNKSSEPKTGNLDTQSVYYDPTYTNNLQQQVELNEKKVDELTNQLASKESQLSVLISELKRQKDEHYQQIEQLTRASENRVEGDQTELTESLKAQIKSLKERLELKEQQNDELNESLKKQASKCDILTEEVQRLTKEVKSQRDSESEHLNTISTLQSDNEALRQEISSLNFELSAKAIQEENLLKVSD